MKKFIFIFLLSFSSLLGYSQLFEDFEAAPPTADASGVWTNTSGNWLVKDNRTNTGQNWKRNAPSGTFPANSGTNAAFVDRENTGPGVYAEEWLITPQRNILANSQLRFFTRQTLAGDTGTKYQVRVSSAADPADLLQYTLVIEYTESELSTLTADQLDYEEKVINLGFTGQRYLAFVKVFTQPAAATSGDRWLIDDVKIVERCIDPVAPLGTPVIGATTTRLEWTSTNTQFQVQYGPAGFTLDVPAPNVVISPVFTNNTAPRRRYEATGLLANTGYQFYVRAVCTDSNSNWVGPFNWNTLPLGRTCAEPIVATNPLPYSDSSNTSIYGNNIVNGSPGGAALCGAGAGFLGGNDVVYSYTATEAGNIFISMNPNGATNTGVFVYASCANVGTTCIAGVGNATANIRVIPSLAVALNQTIYIVISSTTATPTFPYTLTIQQATCPQPVSLTGTVTGPTSATATWANGAGSTATAWEVAVQTAGSDVPTGAGTATTVNTDYLINTTLAGAPLVAGTAYQYWVRAACGDGLFSPWSGPFLFTTTLCETTAQCNYTFVLSDTFNGWEGGRMQVRQNGLVVATLGATLGTGLGPVNVPVPLCDNLPFELFWSEGGAAPDEMRIAIRNPFTQTIYALTTNGQTSIGTILYTGLVDCTDPLCLPVTGVSVPNATITFNSAIINWTTSGVPTTAWDVYIVPQGSPAPTDTTVPTYPGVIQVPFPTTIPLLADTNYTVYIRSVCSVNGPSVWTSGTNFRTKEQCPKPTALTATAITPFGATFGWTNLTGTAWQIIVQLATLPEPAADDIRWDDLVVGASPFLYNGAPLIPETGYEYYIRTLCDGGIISTPAGPRAFTTGIACPRPTVLTATATSFGGTFGWTNPTGTAWQVLVLPAGSPAPTATTTGWIPVNPGEAGPGPLWSWTYNGPPLTPETNYVYYIRTDCGIVNGLSTWAGPRTFTTTPTCFKPTAFSSTALQAFQVTLTWDSVATTTAWQILALPQGDPAPGPGSTGWVSVDALTVGFTQIDANSFSYIYTGLTPETAYSFYIRGNCEPGFGTSTWTTPRNVTTPPSCFKPSAQTATILAPFNPAVSPFTATLGWTNNVNSPVTEWQISIQATGSPAPAVTQIGTTVTANPYLATGLTPNTCYDYYVRSVCGGVNGLSTWTGPFNFCTPPTCPQPINLGSTNPNEPTANLFWTEAGTATQWEYIFQPPLGPVPGAATSGTITNGPAVANVVTVNTGTLAPGFYEFYVRSICSDSDKSIWTGPQTFFIALPPAVCASVEIDVATTSPGVIDLCPGESCVDLTAEFTDSKDTSTYTVLPVIFAPPFPFTGGTQLPVTTDDVWSAPFTLPFNFCFYGVNYPTVNVGSNGVLTFNTQAANSYCPWPFTQTIPNPAFPIRNAIYGVYQDINPAVETAPIVRSINYQILGEAPCRAFVVNYYNIAQFSCNLTLPLQTSQIVLYETSNIIEVYVQDRVSCTNWNSGNGVIGLQNNEGTIAHFPPDRNTGQWTATNEAWRFTPDGNSIVEFSWLKDGAFYSSDATINVCVSEDTNMTAQAIYTGCGGQTTTKTEDVLLNVTDQILEPIADVVACQSYNLEDLTIGNYFSQTGGVGPIGPTITNPGLNTIYVYAETTAVPACEYEISFTVDIQPELVAPIKEPVISCVNYDLPDNLPSPFNYYTGPGGTGTMFTGEGDNEITTPGLQTLYIYGVSGLCTAESTFSVTIDPILTPDFPTPLTICVGEKNPPALELTSPNGIAGTWSPATIQTTTVGTSQYLFTPNSGAPTGPNLVVNGDFSTGNTGFTSDYQFLTVTIPAGEQKTYGIVTNANAWFPGFSACTDHTSGAGNMMVADGSTSNAGNDIVWSQTIPVTADENYTFSYYLESVVAENPAQIDVVINGTVIGSATAGATTCDWVQYTYSWNSGTSTSAQISLYNRTVTSAGNDFAIDDLSFLQNASACANEQSITVNITDAGIIPTFAAISDICSGTDAPQLEPISQNGITGSWTPDVIDNITVGTTTYNFAPDAGQCATPQTLEVTVFAPNRTPTFAAISDICSGTDAPELVPISQNGINGTWTPDVIDNVTIGTATYTFNPADGQCATSLPITINVTAPNRTPTFAAISDICSGTVAPQLEPISQNGINGTWTPDVIDNVTIGTATYTFNPADGQCATPLPITINVTAPNRTPTFAAISDICSGTAAPQLEPISQNSISGTWTPDVIDNVTIGTATYTFNPADGQCALQNTLDVTVLSSSTTDFETSLTICSGVTAPVLEPTSPNGITGSWSPSVVDPTQSGVYVFTPDSNQCATGQSFDVTVSSNPQFAITGGCLNGKYTLTITSADFDLETANFVWSYEGTIINDQNGPSVVVSQAGNYTCEVTYQGCATSEPFNAISVSCTIQKGISPNGTGEGDGLNDYFDLEGQNVSKLEIFNRYGTKVYSKANYSKEWYGQTDDGDELPDGTYFYVIERNGEESKTGWIYINHEL